MDVAKAGGHPEADQSLEAGGPWMGSTSYFLFPLVVLTGCWDSGWEKPGGSREASVSDEGEAGAEARNCGLRAKWGPAPWPLVLWDVCQPLSVPQRPSR